MINISEEELNCLRRLVKQSPKEVRQCDTKLIRRLLAMHLIEEVPVIQLPLEMASHEYRVTNAGLSILKKHPH